MNNSLSLRKRQTGLLDLPAELLYQIWEDVYINWKEVEANSWESRLPPTVPLCKTLTTIQVHSLYLNVDLSSYYSLRSLNNFFKTILARPQLAIFVSTFTFTVGKGYSGSTKDRSNELVVTIESIKSCFRLFSNLKALNLLDEATLALPSLLSLLTSDTLPPQCTSIRFGVPAGYDNTLLTLPVAVKTLETTFIGESFSGRNDLESLELPPLSTLSTLTISRPEANQQAYRQLLSRSPNLRSFGLHDVAPRWNSNPQSLDAVPVVEKITRLSITSTERRERTGRRNYDNQFNVDSYISKFPNLKHLTLGAGTSPHLATFFEELRKLPLESLTFAKGEYVPLAPLVALVSSSTQHLTLRTLTLSFLEKIGKMGTRIADVDIVFEEADVDSESVEDDYMTDDWTMPSFPPNITIPGLLSLQQVGAQSGVVVDGKVFEAIEIEKAYDDDVELLTEIWEGWRKKEKKLQGKKGGKSRK
ncbi:hypothetical protein JCM3765_006733 [Sporobolomyces pararoseus]